LAFFQSIERSTLGLKEIKKINNGWTKGKFFQELDKKNDKNISNKDL
jgi:hypothetical protein